jgi:hypothetical protein
LLTEGETPTVNPLTLKLIFSVWFVMQSFITQLFSKPIVLFPLNLFSYLFCLITAVDSPNDSLQDPSIVTHKVNDEHKEQKSPKKKSSKKVKTN